ncbi:MAG TPA: GNAT family N-acetyltransferase [Solirubrobacteraceae bacterium]|nr:GNAT family N-acetyltransferase [Solirubrobacteraceae bacterium]
MSAAGSPRALRVDAAAGRALRIAVLRPHEPDALSMYPLEEDPETLHFAVLGPAGAPLSVGSAMAEPHPRDPRPGDWRIRGMATVPERRGEGLGAAVLDAIERAAEERGATRLWCNARSGAVRFYERGGFVAEGEEFELPSIGPHFLMSRSLG